MKKSCFPSSFSAIARNYDAFILDLWGVIHDGQQPYPGAKECLKHLRAEGKKIVLLSNAPRRASDAAAAMERMGIDNNFYDALITSGETAYKCMVDAQSAYFRPSGNRYVYIGLEKDRRILDGLDFQETDDPASAHFLILSHSFYDNQPMSELAPTLTRCLAAKLPALCINPDMEVVRQSGEHVYCAGVLAADYATKGGKVIYFGKPHAIVYEAALRIFNSIDRARILAVGDNLATDIAGAMKNNIESVLVTGGVLKNEIGGPEATNYKSKLEALLAKTEAKPDYVLAAFNW